MHPPGTAAALVEAMTDAVHRCYNPRRQVLVPTRLNGEMRVSGMVEGEAVLDRADELLERECETWPLSEAPEIEFDLLKRGKDWIVAWVIDSEPEPEPEEAGDDA